MNKVIDDSGTVHKQYLKNTTTICNKCKDNRVTFRIEVAVYPDGDGEVFEVETVCQQCGQREVVYQW